MTRPSPDAMEMMKVLYCDCFSGISGDMFLAALVEAGLPRPHLSAELARLGLPEFRSVTVARVQRGALRVSQLKYDLTIDRRAYAPAYAQLAHILRSQIAAGLLPPGAQLPSTAQLCERYQVSAMTVRRAIRILVDQGVIRTQPGRGTFVQAVVLGLGPRLAELQSLGSTGALPPDDHH